MGEYVEGLKDVEATQAALDSHKSKLSDLHAEARALYFREKGYRNVLGAILLEEEEAIMNDTAKLRSTRERLEEAQHRAREVANQVLLQQIQIKQGMLRERILDCPRK